MACSYFSIGKAGCVCLSHTPISNLISLVKHSSGEIISWHTTQERVFKKKRSYYYLLIQNNILFNAYKKHSKNYREIYFCLKTPKHIQRKIYILFNFHYSEVDIKNNSKATIIVVKVESKPSPAWERKVTVCFSFMCDGQHMDCKAHTN